MATPDDILGANDALTTKESPDSDGDGVTDIQERLDGTDPGDASDYRTPDPTLAPRDESDLRGDLDRATLERETTFDPTAGVPEGHTIDSGLSSLTNTGGTALPTGANHHGVGDDALLDGRLDNSVLGMTRESLFPTGPTSGAGGTPDQGDGGAEGIGGAGSGEGGGGVTSGGTLQNPKWDLLRVHARLVRA